MSNVLAIDIGGSNFRVGLFDRQGKRLAMIERETLRSGGRDWMLEQVRDRSREIIGRTIAFLETHLSRDPGRRE